jgi:hypothetical protein
MTGEGESAEGSLDRSATFGASGGTGLSRVLNLIDKVPAWIRWIAFLPLGLWVCSLLQGLTHAIVGLTAADLPPNVRGEDPRIYASKFISGVTLNIFPALLSPRPWGVAVATFGVGCLLSLVPVAYEIWMGHVFGQIMLAVLAMGVDSLGGAVGLYVVKKVLQQRRGSATLGASSEPEAQATREG